MFLLLIKSRYSLFPFYKWILWGLVVLNDLPKVQELRSYFQEFISSTIPVHPKIYPKNCLVISFAFCPNNFKRHFIRDIFRNAYIWKNPVWKAWIFLKVFYTTQQWVRIASKIHFHGKKKKKFFFLFYKTQYLLKTQEIY